jgi:hypothetical protein
MTGTITEYRKISVKTATATVLRIKVLEDRNSRRNGRFALLVAIADIIELYYLLDVKVERMYNVNWP